MKRNLLIAALAAATMTMTTTAAAAAPAPVRATAAARPLSLSPAVRAGRVTDGRATALSDGPNTITALFLGGLVVAGIVVAIANSGDDQPDSP